MCDIAAKYKLKAYANVPVTRDNLANAIDGTGALLVRYSLDTEWYHAPIEPLRPSPRPTSGHAVNETNYDGGSFRIANSWGALWGDKGTAYHLLSDLSPTEAWSVWFVDVPKEIEVQIESRASIVGKILNLLQQVIVLVAKLA